jgi:hypothetical protein
MTRSLFADRLAPVPSFGKRLIATREIANRQHGARSVTNNSFGDTTENGVEASNMTVGAHYDELVRTFSRCLEDALQRIARHRTSRDLSVHARGRPIERLVKCSVELGSCLA